MRRSLALARLGRYLGVVRDPSLSNVPAWRPLETREAMRCRVFSVRAAVQREDPVPGEPQKEGEFYVIDAPDWVNVVALTDRDELLLIEQWRHGVDHATLEIPGGMVDPGETPLEAARRELLEETGYRAGTFQAWAYHHRGLPSLAIKPFEVPAKEAKKKGRGAPAGEDAA